MPYSVVTQALLKGAVALAVIAVIYLLSVGWYGATDTLIDRLEAIEARR